MINFPIINEVKNLWQNSSPEQDPPGAIIYLALLGFLIGLFTGVVISIFRITTDIVFGRVLNWTYHDMTFPSACLWIILAMTGAIVTCFLIRNPAIRFGGEKWIKNALLSGQSHAWRLILIPKFIGSWLVMACGISVGREGPCIQMGAATALGMKKFDPKNNVERRFFILGGCAAGLAAAFSAPFAGICYVYEIMQEKISRSLCLFMLCGSVGVYVACTLIFGLGVMLPVGQTFLPDLAYFWLLIPLGIFSGIVGIAYNYGLRVSMNLFNEQNKIPATYRPFLAFGASAIMVMIFPAVTGEGLNIFTGMENGQALAGFLCFFLIAKLILTSFCYGTGIPAGVMVPVLCLGGVSGGLYTDFIQYMGWLPAHMSASFIVMGMAGAFAAAERAPITSLVLVIEMTGSYATAPGMLFVCAIATFAARIVKVKEIENELLNILEKL